MGGVFSSMNLTAVGGAGTLMMEGSSFFSTQERFNGGMVDWIIDMPDGAVRTVQIQGMGNGHAWGLCGSCNGKVFWRASCSENMADCIIEWSDGGDGRRLARELQARAEPTSVGERGSVERSLGDKSCM